LSYPLKYNNEVIGVLCCENQNSIKNWDEEEIKFIQLVSVITALHLVNENIKNTVNEKDTLNTSVISN
ncbi:MAG: GAF domain-containing protein, partial [Bacteroidia bacterium]|nr:GAF domain-containing protein [Bacteroidia bacterium]